MKIVSTKDFSIIYNIIVNCLQYIYRKKVNLRNGGFFLHFNEFLLWISLNFKELQSEKNVSMHKKKKNGTRYENYEAWKWYVKTTIHTTYSYNSRHTLNQHAKLIYIYILYENQSFYLTDIAIIKNLLPSLTSNDDGPKIKI